MDWIKTTDPQKELPKDKVFFALWKGAFCVAEYDEEEDHFYVCFMPAIMSGIMKVCKDRVRKFTHYFIPEFPEDYGQ